MNIAELVGSLDTDQLAELKKALGVGVRGKKPPSPEFVAAQSALEGFKNENELICAEYDRLKEELRACKGVRKVLATKRYNLDTSTGIITTKEGEDVATFGEEGWQSAVRASGFTVGQVAAISKTMRAAVQHTEPVGV